MSASLSRLRVHLKLIDDGVAPVVERYRAHIECRAGCSACCHQTFAVSELEGELLREGLQRAPPAVREDIVARARAFVPGTGVACPVLAQDGHCRLYAHRPRICRKYGIPLWHPDHPERVTTCELNFRGVTDIDPELVLDPQAAWAEDWIRLREELALTGAAHRPIAAHVLQGRAP